VDFVIKDKALKEFVENAAMAWKVKYPERARAYRQVLQEDLKAQVNVSGMTKEGRFRFSGSVPADIFYLLEWKFPGFFKSPHKLRIFQDVFMGKMRPMVSEQKVFFGGIEK